MNWSFLGSKVFATPIRTAHVVAMALLLGGRAYAPGDPSLAWWQLLTAATGLALLVTEAVHSRHWAYQGRGVAALAHVALALAAARGGVALTVLSLVVGAVGSHLPRTVRWWSLRHGRVLE